MIKTFRGQMADGDQDTIPLHTQDGSIGYRIVKFDVMGITENENFESTVKIYSIKQTAINTTVDFSNETLLASALYHDSALAPTAARHTIIFDDKIVNQDIYVTYADTTGSGPAMNYVIQLEQIKLDLNESTVATLKDIRNLEYPPAGG